jgi:hypothetical protein
LLIIEYEVREGQSCKRRIDADFALEFPHTLWKCRFYVGIRQCRSLFLTDKDVSEMNEGLTGWQDANVDGDHLAPVLVFIPINVFV